MRTMNALQNTEKVRSVNLPGGYESAALLSPIIGRFALHPSWKFAAVGLKNYPPGRRRPCVIATGLRNTTSVRFGEINTQEVPQLQYSAKRGTLCRLGDPAS